MTKRISQNKNISKFKELVDNDAVQFSERFTESFFTILIKQTN